MKKVFNLQNPFYQNVVKIVDFFYLNILILLASSFIITAGTAFSAGYYTYNKMFFSDETKVFETFWYSFKDNFKDTFVVFTLSMGMFILLYINYQASEQGIIFFNGFKYVFLFLGFLLATYLLHYLCLAARFENTIKERLLTTLSSFFLNLHLTILLFITILVCYFMVMIIPITFLISSGLLIAVSHHFFEDVFQKYLKG